MSSLLHPTELGTILSIWAHPDDETFLAGGIMAAAVAAGQRVVCLSATWGEHGTDDPVTWPPHRLTEIRRWESRAAMAILGVDEHLALDLPDGGLDAIDSTAWVPWLAELIRTVDADTVLTFGPDGMTFHPDHRTIGTWTTVAWETAGRPGRLLHAVHSRSHLETWAATYEEWGIYMSDERPTGVDDETLSVKYELSGAALDQKMTALAAMASQTGPTIASLGRDVLASNSSVETFVQYVG
ncbi:MAG: PIG-L deacetylase family protein [Acidimicrobiales bacterium]